MSKGGRRRNVDEDAVISRIDRGLQRKEFVSDDEEDGVKMKLHQCKPGDWVRQVHAGKGHYGPPLRVLDPKSGTLEDRRGKRSQVPPKSRVLVMPSAY